MLHKWVETWKQCVCVAYTHQVWFSVSICGLQFMGRLFRFRPVVREVKGLLKHSCACCSKHYTQ